MNLSLIKTLSKLFDEENKILDVLKKLSDVHKTLESKTDHDDEFDKIVSMILNMVTKFRPNYGPIVAGLNRITVVRNKICRLELDMLS